MQAYGQLPSINRSNSSQSPDFELLMMTTNNGVSRSPRQNNDMPSGYKPAKHDVICGKGKTCFEHEGNIRFRKLVGTYLTKYSGASTKIEKSSIVSEIIETTRENGSFIKKRPKCGTWFEVGKHLAREKVGQTIRDMLHLQYKSSTKAKKKRREAEQAKASANMNRITRTHLEISEKIEALKGEVTKADNDRTLSELFTNANLEILRSLNRLRATQAQQKQPSLLGDDVHTSATEITPPPPMLTNTVTPELMFPSEKQQRLQRQDSGSVIPMTTLSTRESSGFCGPELIRSTSNELRLMYPTMATAELNDMYADCYNRQDDTQPIPVHCTVQEDDFAV
mmetsp:Transcript_50842/g.76015  ORF Transcript_50842/g.76015 Transcript_50842/m.76015 type:complete len:338 (-) Transcript_50842:119-1132(-)|eukprot:CAMPEP_0194049694 /NCGR_PEP_ID=MMETSP0009_2-20130614/30838_1 /TAXON_ID=210454 /ORGANISM="Grammatophora oceanica, Strain CCMP 410" /LENGTH=337 /DNA_ID=CAMNT_0038695907 /DNA_START=220 /DNA_END=1233 /DNA_ORIENTATION=-